MMEDGVALHARGRGERVLVAALMAYEGAGPGFPGFPVAVVGCKAHRQGCYALYPPGHCPYGRMSIVPYSATGELSLGAQTRQPQWETTVMAAAVDANKGDLWPEEGRSSKRPAAGRRRTQGRHLAMAGRLTGVHAQLDQRQRERIAARRGVATLTLIDGARRWGRSWRSRGAAILAVLSAIPIGASLLDRMLAAGAVSGLWDSHQRRRTPQRWDTRRGSWVIAPAADSELTEQRATEAARERGPPATNPGDPAGAGGATFCRT